MNSYTYYWPAGWVKTIINNNDTGPLTVIYGGEHRSQPPLGKVRPGDVVYPVTLMDGGLYILARMTIDRIIHADEYTATLGIVREPFMWDSYTHHHTNSITHQIPRTCADDAAVGTNGTAIVLRRFPPDLVPSILLGPKPGSEQPLKMRNGTISINNFSGYFRRLSENSVKQFDAVIDQVPVLSGDAPKKFFPFSCGPGTAVLCCRHLLEEAGLFRVYHLATQSPVWRFTCREEHMEDDLVESTLGEMLRRFPETGELADIPGTLNVMFQRGVNSGKWYDFHFQ